MCCKHRHHHGGSCGCGGHVQFGRRFWTREEKITGLEQYLDSLRAEAKAVEERIAEMREE